MQLFFIAPGRFSRFLIGTVLVGLLATSAGCGTNLVDYYFGGLFGKRSSTIDKNAEQLAIDGAQKMREKKYKDALKAFQKLKEQYPYSKYAILADLKIGDANFYDRNYSDAAIAYEEFARLHPRNEVVPYVMYQVGMSHFLGFSTIDRDPAETQAAIEAFRRVIQAYPDSQYSLKAKKQLFECEKRLVAHEFYVGEFYFKREQYQSAKDRLERISKAYPESVRELGYEESIKKMIEVSDKKLAQGPRKPSIWKRVGF